MAIGNSLTHLPPERVWLAPVGPRLAPLFSFGLLTTASILASLVFACATPFASIAIVAASMVPLPSALLVVAAAWLVNQTIGFGLLHYPVDASTMLWGLVMGGGALAATATPMRVLRLARRAGTPVAMGTALAGAYATYELALFAATPILGGAENFTVAIIGRLGLSSVLWTIGLVAACEIVRFANPVFRRLMPHSVRVR